MVRLLVDSVRFGKYFFRSKLYSREMDGCFRATVVGRKYYSRRSNNSDFVPYDDDDGFVRSRREELSKFIDSLRIHVKAGNGGDGLPSRGGMGGKGGDVIVVGSDKPQMTLQTVQRANHTQRYAAKHGEKSKLFCIFAKNGESIKIPIPLGVSVVNDKNKILGDVNEADDEIVVCKGGDGGASHNGYCGQQGQVQTITLDLKLIADVGFVGFPNAGKSTLLKALSRARPRIASFPFTTVRPNIGIIEYADERQISVADLPGLIEGAHLNKGMGHKFLKHVERTKLLLFVVDLHGFQLGPKFPHRSALETICLLNKELEMYQEDLLLKPALLALNKTDLPGAYPIIENVRDTLFNDDAYLEYIQTLPEEYRPKHPIRFDDIVPISAKKGPTSVGALQDMIRKYIDINFELSRPDKLKWHI